MLRRFVIAYVSFMFCLFFMVFTVGCGEKTEDKYTDADTGAADFSLIWLDEDLEQRVIQSKGDICNDKGISFIKVDVYDGSFGKYLTGKTFPCTDGEGTVYGIASGKDRIFNLSGLNDQGETLYVGEQKGIEIVTGKVVSVGFITMHRNGNLPPTATIDTSEHGPNPVYTVGEEITFKGTGHDKEDGELTGDALVWTLDDNDIGTGDTCTLSGLGIGEHSIILTVTDDDQATGRFSVIFSVNKPGNINPEAQITLPISGTRYNFGAEIKFKGRGTDLDGDTLNFEWKLEGDDDLIGTGREFTTSNLPAGNHEIILRVKDGNGGMGADTVKIIVLQNEMPVAKITPLEKYTYIQGELIEFVGTGTDKEDTLLDYTWYSSEDKNIGTGSRLTISDLSVGSHTITLTVEDQHKGTGTATVNITVLEYEAPVAKIIKPVPGPYIPDESIAFSGTCENKDDALLDFEWRLNKYRVIGTEPEFIINDLSVGTHTITLTITDQYDGTDTASVTIKVSEVFTNSLDMTFRAPKTTFPATFLMGSPEDETARDDDEILHEVAMTQPFFIQTTEITNAQYVSFLNDVGQRGPEGEPWFKTKEEDVSSHITSNTDDFGVESGYGNHPVIFVSWYGAMAFADWLSEKENKDYRLPTEAQWEFAARAGTDTPFYFGECLSTDQANYNGNYPNGCSKGEYRASTTEVASLVGGVNAWGLYDMHGNVYEWCADWYESDYYEGSPKFDPAGPSSGTDRVLRGGGWDFGARSCRTADRFNLVPGVRGGSIGFRLVLLPGQY